MAALVRDYLWFATSATLAMAAAWFPAFLVISMTCAFRCEVISIEAIRGGVWTGAIFAFLAFNAADRRCRNRDWARVAALAFGIVVACLLIVGTAGYAARSSLRGETALLFCVGTVLTAGYLWMRWMPFLLAAPVMRIRRRVS